MKCTLKYCRDERPQISVELLQTQRGGKCYPFSKSFIVVARARAIDKWVIRTGDLFAVQRQVMLEGCLLMASIKIYKWKTCDGLHMDLGDRKLRSHWAGRGEDNIRSEFVKSLQNCKSQFGQAERLREFNLSRNIIAV